MHLPLSFQDDLQWHGTSNKKREGWLKGINAKKVFVSEVEQLTKYNVDEGKSPVVHIDFERLFPLTRPPKVSCPRWNCLSEPSTLLLSFFPLNSYVM